MNPRDAQMLIATLRAAAQARSDPAPPTDWRSNRDRWIDVLDPSGDHGDPNRQEIRGLVQFLAETAPAQESRQSSAEWGSSVEVAVVRLLSALPDAQ